MFAVKAPFVRPTLFLLALLSLAVRWGDAACGCAAHHHWMSQASGQRDGHGGCHDHDSSTGPVIGHGCEGEAGDAVYPLAVRTLPVATVADPSWTDAVSLVAAEFAGWVDGHRPSGPPSRAALSVYRI